MFFALEYQVSFSLNLKFFLRNFISNLFNLFFLGNSYNIWQVSPPSLDNLKQLLIDPNQTVEFDFMYTLTR